MRPMDKKDFILASGSPQRRMLLEQIGMTPKEIVRPDIDESEHAGEAPIAYVKRMAREKAKRAVQLRPNENILACDTIVAVGRRILHKAENAEEQARVMRLLSGNTSRVLSAVCVISRQGKIAERLSVSRVQTKPLSAEEIAAYVAGKEWEGCSGYKIEGSFAAYVKRIVGSYSGIVGLPLFETKNLLNGIGVG